MTLKLGINQFISTRDVAILCGLSDNAVTKRAKRRGIVGEQIGMFIHYKRFEVYAIAESLRTDPNEEPVQHINTQRSQSLAARSEVIERLGGTGNRNHCMPETIRPNFYNPFD